MLSRLKAVFENLEKAIYEALEMRFWEYPEPPRNQAGGFVDPGPEEYNRWAIEAFGEAAKILGLRLKEKVDDAGYGTPLVRVEAYTTDGHLVAVLEYAEGNHYPLNARSWVVENEGGENEE